MPIDIEVERNLIGLEDLLVGTGTVSQVRAGEEIDITKINAQNFPYSEDVSLGDRLLQLQNIAESLSIVDTEGNYLTGYLNTSAEDLDLENRLWQKQVSPNVRDLYFGHIRILKYNSVSGDLILPEDTNYIAADNALYDAVVTIITTNVATLNQTISDLGSASTLDAGVGANNLVQLDNEGKLPAVDASNLTGIGGTVPVGHISQIPYTDVDDGWLECDGSEVSRVEYEDLFEKIGISWGSGDDTNTFNLPDLRGEFVRGWDNGREIDTGRVFGTNQADEFRAHGHRQGRGIGSSPGRNARGGGDGSLESGNPNIGNYTAATGGSETRPRNVALMYVIKT